ncbi:MAG: addiction module protein [Bacteroidales bacterium]|nr:addiction module protein [Bacteroidales bacterium]
MLYTIKINDNSTQAQSIIHLLKELAHDYEFLQIYEEEPELTEEATTELNRRYEYFLQNPTKGKTWEEVKQNLSDK